MKRRSRIISILFSISFLAGICFAVLAMLRLSTLSATARKVELSQGMLSRISLIEGQMQRVRVMELQCAINCDTAALTNFLNTRTTLLEYMTGMARLTEDSNTRRQLKILSSDLTIITSACESIMQMTKRGLDFRSPSMQDALRRSEEAGTAAQKHINLLREKFVDQYKSDSTSRESKTNNITQTIILLTAVFGVISLILFGFLITASRQRNTYEVLMNTSLASLTTAHQELGQIAYAASHDLQEPLRKIRIFSDRLTAALKDKNMEPERELAFRMDASAARMQALVHNLMSLASLANTHEPVEKVSLAVAARRMWAHLRELHPNIEAKLETGELPEIAGFPAQINILFEALLDNCFKYSHPGKPLAVHINSAIFAAKDLPYVPANIHGETEFHRVTISDNGIGFDNEFAGKMFGLFKRLHTDDNNGYNSTGIGLAICKRVMSNHFGWITAEGRPGKGATFLLFFPVDNQALTISPPLT